MDNSGASADSKRFSPTSIRTQIRNTADQALMWYLFGNARPRLLTKPLTAFRAELAGSEETS
jgi:hypothetical protein